MDFLFKQIEEMPTWSMVFFTMVLFWWNLLTTFENRLKIKGLTQELKDTRYRLDELKASLGRSDFDTIKVCNDHDCCCEPTKLAYDFTQSCDKSCDCKTDPESK